MREVSREKTGNSICKVDGNGNEYEQQRERDGNGNWSTGMGGNVSEKLIPAHL